MSGPEFGAYNRDDNVMYMNFPGFVDLNNCMNNHHAINRPGNKNGNIVENQRKIRAGQNIIVGIMAQQVAESKNVEIFSKARNVFDDTKLRKHDLGLGDISNSKIESCRIPTILALQSCGERM